MLTKIFNELMEKERDEYLENTSYQREILIGALTVMDTTNVTTLQK